MSDYDEGDCCECTCVSTDSFTCGDESHGGYACIDPSAACVDDDDVTTNPGDYSSTTVSGCIPAFKSDGDCDQTNNIEDCGGLNSWFLMVSVSSVCFTSYSVGSSRPRYASNTWYYSPTVLGVEYDTFLTPSNVFTLR